MSKRMRETIACPECGEQGMIDIWESINSVLSPNEAHELLYGKLFEYVCPACGSATEVFYPCLHHDMEKRAMIQYAPDKNQAESMAADLDRLLNNSHLRHMVEVDGYRCRIVFSHNDLREKARIIHDGLDDRAIEIIKLMVEAMALENPDDHSPFSVYYDRTRDDGNLEFVILGEEAAAAKVPFSVYENLLPLPAERIDGEYFIDRDWALKHYKKILADKQ